MRLFSRRRPRAKPADFQAFPGFWAGAVLAPEASALSTELRALGARVYGPSGLDRMPLQGGLAGAAAHCCPFVALVGRLVRVGCESKPGAGGGLLQVGA